MATTLAGIGVIQAVLYLAFVRATDLYEREPLRTVVAVFVWGFAVASVLSLVFNSILRVYFSSVATVRQASFLRACYKTASLRALSSQRRTAVDLLEREIA